MKAMTEKWKKYEGQSDSYALCVWRFRRSPGQCEVFETASTLKGVCALIPSSSLNDEGCFDVIHIGQWITDGEEEIPHPDHITTLFSVTPQEADPSEEEDDD